MASAPGQDKPVEAAVERAAAERAAAERNDASAGADPLPERARAAADALLRFNLAVSGILAHDLKNPVSGVLMNARLLPSADAEGARRLGARIVTSAERMSRMIDQIGEWARLQQSLHSDSADGGVPIACHEGDLGAIAEAVVAEFRSRKPEVPLSLTREGQLAGRWDAERIAQILWNLIANAIDYAAVPGVAVALGGRSPDEVTFSVSNEGAIADPVLPLLFEPFRARPSGSGLRGRGLGLGLFLAREIARAHGGRIDVDRSTAGLVRFVVTLPRFVA